MGDERASWRPSSYGYALGGCELSLRFPVAKLLDFESQWETLQESINPFGTLVMAHLKTKATRGQPQDRKQWKGSLVRSLFERGYSRTEVVQLFRLIDWMMVLPEELQQEFTQELRLYQEDRPMPFLSRVELHAKQEGKQEGIQEGTLKNAREAVLEVLEARFEVVSPTVSEALNKIVDVAVLKRLLRQAITISSVVEFQQLFNVSEDNLEG